MEYNHCVTTVCSLLYYHNNQPHAKTKKIHLHPSFCIMRRKRRRLDTFVSLFSPELAGQQRDRSPCWVSRRAEAHYAALCCYDKAGTEPSYPVHTDVPIPRNLLTNNTMSLEIAVPMRYPRLQILQYRSSGSISTALLTG